MARLAFAALLCLLAAGAAAEPVKCVDAKGKVRYIDSTMIGTETCQVVKEGINTVPPQAAPSSTPRENRETRAARPRPPQQASPNPNSDEQTEAKLAAAAERLAEAQKNLAEQEAIRLGGERNFARVQERLQPFQEAVERAQQEVDQVRRESR
jgi:hypothetical protein